jgi:prepilin-type N-terminal cleavage/methylation domain-containing protein
MTRPTRPNADLRSFATSAARARRGFTLVELLTVMAVIAIAFGLAVGSLQRTGKAGALDGATRLVRSHLTRARMLAISGGALSRVRIDAAEPEKNLRARVTTEFTRAAGTWHFEDRTATKALYGENMFSTVIGAVPIEDGSFRSGVDLFAAARIVSPTLDEAPTFDPTRGFAFFCDVFPSGAGPIVRFGKPAGGGDAFLLSYAEDGSLTAEVGLVFDPALETQQKIDRRRTLKTRPGVVEKNAWARVGLSYDGVTIELFAHGVAEAIVQETRDVEVASGSALVFGGGFAGRFDEAEYFTTSAPEVVEFESGVDLSGATSVVVRFGRDGRLNEKFHAAPVVAKLVLDGDSAAVAVDVSGIVR